MTRKPSAVWLEEQDAEYLKSFTPKIKEDEDKERLELFKRLMPRALKKYPNLIPSKALRQFIHNGCK